MKNYGGQRKLFCQGYDGMHSLVVTGKIKEDASLPAAIISKRLCGQRILFEDCKGGKFFNDGRELIVLDGRLS